MNSLIEELLSRSPVLTDGAWGTQLQARGLPVGECPDEWNLSRPEIVGAVARGYVEAGSRIILTNTFGSNRHNLARHNLAERANKLNLAGVEISRRCADDRAFVFGSMGPSGAMLLSGEVAAEDLLEMFAEQAQSLSAAGVHGIVIETMSDLEEAKLAVTAARRTGLPVVACMVFDSGKEGDRTMMGVTPEQAAQGLVEAGADVIGANCGQGIETFLPICKRLHAATDRPIWIKPNAGLPEMVDGRAVYKVKPEEFARHAPELVKAGANFVGGCCGTGPEFIRACREALQR